MNVYKLLVKMNEGSKDYVSATVFNMGDAVILQLPDIRKPDNKADYTTTWKTGVYYHYEALAKAQLDEENITFIHL